MRKRARYSTNGLQLSKQEVVAVGPQSSDFIHEADVSTFSYFARRLQHVFDDARDNAFRGTTQPLF